MYERLKKNNQFEIGLILYTIHVSSKNLLTHLPRLALVIFVMIAYHSYVALDKICKDKENSIYERELIGINLVDGSTLQCTPVTVLTGRIIQGFHVISVIT